MLTINLVPFEELENKRWYIPDLLIALGIGGAASLLFLFYVNQYKDKIESLHQETAAMQGEISSLQPKIDRFLAKTRQAENLRDQLVSLEHITTARVPRYRPVILLEQLQKLKPEGLWFKNIKEQTADSSLILAGESYDNLLVAQFIAALNSSRKLSREHSAGATKIEFIKVNLHQLSEVGSEQAVSKETNHGHPLVHYDLQIIYQEQAEQNSSS